MTIPGVDYAWSHPGGAALHAAGKQFAARYLSHDATKNLTRTEANDLAAHGIWSVVVWETTAQRAGAGRAAGIADAQEAARQATAAGMPGGRPIYFAVDYDATPSAVDAYFQGVGSVLGAARVGVYGGYAVVKHCLDTGLARWAWQTPAWSGGKWEARAHIRQGAQTRINGVSVDLDTATVADYGQWQPGVVPNHPAPKPPAKPKVSLRNVVFAAHHDPTAAQGHQSHPADVRPVEAALKAEGYLSAKYAADGSFGSLTVAAYAKWQRHLGYAGHDADGIPGKTSLTKLGQKHGFTVTT